MEQRRKTFVFTRTLLAMALLAGLLHGSSRPAAAATQVDIHGPAGSGNFGRSVAVLPNGNFVVTDPGYDQGSTVDVGAAYLYNGASGERISTLTGSTANDQVGSGGVDVLGNGNYVVSSPNWDNGAAANAGAVTWGSAVSGVSGAVSEANSLVGSTAGDRVGDQTGTGGVTMLSDGDYVVRITGWDNGAAADAGAVTWGNGETGVMGVVSEANSLVGSHADDQVGAAGVKELTTGNYVVVSPEWDRGGLVDAGAVTGGSGTAGVRGVVSALNSLVGGHPNDRVGSGGVYVLSTGNYVVVSPDWDRIGAVDAGAVTGGSGVTGVKGVVSAANSLVGDHDGDRVGSGGVTVLSDGDYVVSSPGWNNGAIANAGAVTWGSGVTGVEGLVSDLNSLVGGIPGDEVGSGGVMALTNGNYVVRSPIWDNGATAHAGAVTWGDGDGGTVGLVSADNSLVGSHTDDQVGDNVTALSNGHYVVRSPDWDNDAAADAGAVTWGDGDGGAVGAVSEVNSLVGGTAGDQVGSYYVTALSNGNYVVRSPDWDNDAAADAGAVTWGNGDGGTVGPVSADNSLVGSHTDDQVGVIVTALSNGNYVASSLHWSNDAAADAGAATWGSGVTGVKGVVSEANSLVGSTANDRVGSYGVTALSNGNYVVLSADWDNGAAANAGAVTWGNGVTGVKGVVSEANSLVGSTAEDEVGSYFVTALSNGNYVAISPRWDNGSAANAGAVTWGSGVTGVKGAVSEANSLVGGATGDEVGGWSLSPQDDGSYVVRTPTWDNGAAADAGAVTWGFGPSGVSGPIGAANSVRGAAAGGGELLNYEHDPINRQLVVGRPLENIVTLFRLVNGVSVTPPTGAGSGAPGASVNYTLQVSNTGDLADTFSLAASGNHWTTVLPATVGPLAPGAGQAVTVRVTVPASASGGSDTVTITVRSQADNTKTDTAVLTTTVTTPPVEKIYMPIVRK